MRIDYLLLAIYWTLVLALFAWKGGTQPSLYISIAALVGHFMIRDVWRFLQRRLRLPMEARLGLLASTFVGLKRRHLRAQVEHLLAVVLHDPDVAFVCGASHPRVVDALESILASMPTRSPESPIAIDIDDEITTVLTCLGDERSRWRAGDVLDLVHALEQTTTSEFVRDTAISIRNAFGAIAADSTSRFRIGALYSNQHRSDGGFVVLRVGGLDSVELAADAIREGMGLSEIAAMTLALRAQIYGSAGIHVATTEEGMLRVHKCEAKARELSVALRVSFERNWRGPRPGPIRQLTAMWVNTDS